MWSLSWGNMNWSKHQLVKVPKKIYKKTNMVKLTIFCLISGVPVGDRRDVLRHSGGKTQMGFQDVRRRRQWRHWHSRNDQNSSGNYGNFRLVLTYISVRVPCTCSSVLLHQIVSLQLFRCLRLLDPILNLKNVWALSRKYFAREPEKLSLKRSGQRTFLHFLSEKGSIFFKWL